MDCRSCRFRVASFGDLFMKVRPAGVFIRLVNVDVSDDGNYHKTDRGTALADAYCVQCRTFIGWKIITIHRPDMYVREGRFFMNLDKLSLWNDVPLLHLNEDQDGDATDQDGDTTDQDGDATDQDEDATDQDGDADKENADQDGDVNDGDATDQDGDTTDQDGDATDQDGDATDQDGDATDQDGDATDQDGDTTDHDEDFTDQDGDTTDQDGDATAQDGDVTDENADIEENADHDGGERPSTDYLYCRGCSTQVALIQDYTLTENDLGTVGFFTRLFNADVSEDVHRVINGNNLYEINCILCSNLLGWTLIAVSQPSRNYREGFYMRLGELIYCNNVTLLDFLSRDTTDEDGDTTDEDGDTTDQDGDSNEERADQDGDTTEQDLGANEQNAGQNSGTNEQNVDQDGDTNEQVPNEQDVGRNEQNAEQDGGGNEQNDDQDGGAPMN